MEYNKLNNSICEELFGGELDVVEVPDDFEKSQARQYRNWLHQLNERDWCSLQKVMDTLKTLADPGERTVRQLWPFSDCLIIL